LFSELAGGFGRRISYRLLAVAATGLVLWGADWPMQSGNPQRNGWAKSEHEITKQNVANLSVLYKYKADNQAHGQYALSSPIINGNLITYRGFKEMLIFSGTADKVFSVDADLNKLIWESRFGSTGTRTETVQDTSCPGGMTSPVLMAGSSSAFMHFATRSSRLPAAGSLTPPQPRSPYFPALTQNILPLRPTTLSELAALYTVSSDGKLHIINSSTGEDLLPAINFIPPGANVSSLNLHENVVYATTVGNCDGHENALYALDLLAASHGGVVLPLKYGNFSGSAATAIGNDGTVYVEVAHGTGNSIRDYYDTVLALDPHSLNVKDYFVVSSKSVKKGDLEAPGITPLVFPWKGRDVIVAGGRDGRVYVLDSRSLGGSDHKTPLFKTDVLAEAGKEHGKSGFADSFSTYNNVDTEQRYIYVPVNGPLSGSAKFPSGNGTAAKGSLLAFEFLGAGEQPSLRPLWQSTELISPASAVIANGMTFALSRGLPSNETNKDGAGESHPVLYGFDALTGAQLYSSKDSVTESMYRGGLALANGRVYFTTQDNTVYCFGLLQTQPQLREKE
jgi:outer membrane protein assembly factor BamB